MRVRPSGLARGMLVGLLALASFSVASVAFGYFTSNASAEGGFVLRLTPDTEIHETYGSRAKHVRISNSEESVPLYVRARAFSSMPVAYSGGSWDEKDDGWLYCVAILEPGSETPTLDVSITFPTDGTDDSETGDEHDVIVVYETVPVRHDESGNPLDAEACWSKASREGR